MATVSQAFRCFDEVAQRGSIRKAALSLHLTAAAVNQQILNLEASVGAQLFDRISNGVKLTPAGEILLMAARRSAKEINLALSQIQDLHAKDGGRVGIGISHSMAESSLPTVLEDLLRQYPGIRFNIKSGSGDHLMKWLARGDIDLAYCIKQPPVQDIEEISQFSHRLGVAVAHNHPLSRWQRQPTLKDCLDWPVVLFAPSLELRIIFNRIESINPGELHPIVETASISIARDLISSGAGIGFLLPQNIAGEIRTGMLKWMPLVNATARFESALYRRSDYLPSAAHDLFINSFIQCLSRYQNEPLLG